MTTKMKEYSKTYDTHRIQYFNVFESFLKYGKFSYNNNVIDIGCGTGRYTGLFAAKTKTSLLCGLDKSLDMLKIAKENDPVSNYVLGSICSLPFKNNSFHTAIMNLVIQWIPNKKLALSEVYRILKPNGIFILSTFSHKQLRNLILMKHFPEIYQIEEKRFPDIDELKKSLEEVKFKIKIIEEINENREYHISDLIRFAEDKASFPLKFYAEEKGETHFRNKIKEYSNNLNKSYTNKLIHEIHDYTMIVCVK